jgi:hypothetical protein
MKHIVILHDGTTVEADGGTSYVVNGDGYLEIFKNNEVVATFAPGWQSIAQAKVSD